MNPVYDNRVYYAHNPTFFNNILRHVAIHGNIVGSTREFTNTRIVIPVIDREFKEYFKETGAKMRQVNALMKAIDFGDNAFITDTYDSLHYTFLKDEMKRAGDFFVKDCALTRRAVITFPATHCFENIQLLRRDGDLVVTVNMRSCNAYANLTSDIYLAFLLAREAYISAFTHPPFGVSMVVNIGSLHIFKEDTTHVLRNA